MGQSMRNWFLAEPYHVFDVIKYSEMLCSAVGANIYQYVGDPANRIAKLTVARTVNFIVVHVMLMVVAAIHASIPYELMNNGSIIVTYGIRTILQGGMFGTSGIIMYLAWKWKSFIQLLQKIHQLDLKFQQMKHPVNFVAHKKYIFTAGGLLFLLYLTLLTSYNISTVLYIDDPSVSWRMVFGQLYFNAIYLTVVFRFYALACVVSFRFVHLNNALRLRFDTSNGERHGLWLDGTRYRGGTVQERIRIVQRMADMHHQLNEITDHMSGIFGFVILGNMFVLMQFCAFNVFALLKVYASKDTRTVMFAVFNFGGSSFYTLMFMLFVQQSRKVAKESKLTGVLLHKAMNNETNGELIRSMVVFSRQIRNRTAIIGSNHIIFDWPFIFQVVGVLVSYLVILLQFDAFIRLK